MPYEKFSDGTVKCIEEEVPFELPEGWCWTRFITTTINRDAERKPIASSQRTDVAKIYDYYGASGIIDKIDKFIFSERLLLIGEDGANLLSRSKPIAFFADGDYWVNNHAHCIDSTDKQLLDYICVFINAIDLSTYTTGSAQPKLTQDNLNSILIPFPPFDEQKRIIRKINEILSIVESIEDSKADLQSTVQLTKSKILDLAIRGKLVPQDPNDEPASVLLERIRAEKEELIKQGKIKRDSKESVIFRGEDNSYYLKLENSVETIDDWKLDDIPESWGVCCLGEVCDYGNCMNVETKYISESSWILDLEDIEKDTGKVIKKISKKERNSASTKHLFRKDQVLYSKLRPYLNKVVLADDNGYCTSEILPLDFNDCIYPAYARYYLMSPTFLRYANHISYGVKMPRLGTLDGKKSVLSVPPLNEQKRIADKVSQLFSLLDSITENVN